MHVIHNRQIRVWCPSFKRSSVTGDDPILASRYVAYPASAARQMLDRDGKCNLEIFAHSQPSERAASEVYKDAGSFTPLRQLCLSTTLLLFAQATVSCGKIPHCSNYTPFLKRELCILIKLEFKKKSFHRGGSETVLPL